jgi:L-asparaginase II
VYLRSTAKPFIAAAAIEAGVRERFGLDPREIAVMAASHFGEPYHVEAVASILNKIGMDASALQCGAHLPYDENSARTIVRSGLEPSPLYNNCSGKHAGILALCKAIGADVSTYLEPSNPAQRHILRFCARLCDDNAETWPLGVDGCGIPVYATSLRKAALSFARFACLDGVEPRDATALGVVRDAMVTHPEYVAGTGQLDTLLMQTGDGAIACKGGAEGVHGVAVIAQGWGYVAKVLDGAGRARGPSTIAVLRALGALDSEQGRKLARFARPIVYNRAGRAVGEIRTAESAIKRMSR